MKKIIVLSLLVLVVGVFTGCQSKAESDNTIKIGATPVPHGELLDLIKDDLEADGIKLEVVEFTDYIQPNIALNDGEIDANFFQHVPYLDSFSEEHKLDLVSIGTIHVEPLGLYSEKYETVSDIQEGGLIAIPSDAVNGGRALILLEANGLIKLKEGAGLEATEKDIDENPHNFKFKAIEAAQLPRVLPDVDGAVINGNYALDADLVPTEDALILEGSESPYANIVVVKKGDEEEAKYQKLLDALQSDKVKEYIEATYDGGVVPAFGR